MSALTETAPATEGWRARAGHAAHARAYADESGLWDWLLTHRRGEPSPLGAPSTPMAALAAPPGGGDDDDAAVSRAALKLLEEIERDDARAAAAAGRGRARGRSARRPEPQRGGRAR